MRGLRVLWPVALLVVALAIAGCGDDEGPAPAEKGATQVQAGFVGAMDQIGLPAALDRGYYDEQELDVKVSKPFATGVDMLNALDAGKIDVAQVGVPAIAAIQKGQDLVLLGNYTGSASQLGIDDTMAIVAGAGSGIEKDDPASLRGKRIGVTVGSINQLYLLAVLEKAGLKASDVEIVNTPPEDMSVALEKKGVDAIAIWDPFPILAAKSVKGSSEVLRGGGYIGFIGYIVAKRDWVNRNRDAVKRFLTARAQADKWMRDNPDQAAQVATRWLPGTDRDVASEAMKTNVKQLDPRLSACNYAALDQAQRKLNDLGALKGTIDVNKHVEPSFISQVEEEESDLFEDLDQVPSSARIDEGFEFRPGGDQCPA